MSNKLSIHGELNNFIDYYTSDDELRRKMRDCVIDYLEEVREEPPTVVFIKTVYKDVEVYEKHFVGDLDPCKEKFPLTELSAKVHKYQALGCVVEIR
jgi:hypothetical protein